VNDLQESPTLPLGADVRRLRDLTRGCDTVFLIQTPRTDANGGAAPAPGRDARAPVARPMVFRGIDDQGCVWHFVDAASMRARPHPTHPLTDSEPEDALVSLAWSDPLRGRWVSATGRASLVRDRARMGHLWTSADAVWFPQGLATPELALLRVALTEARYWETEAGGLARARWHLRRALSGGLPSAPPPLPTVAGTILLRTSGSLGGAVPRPTEAAP
jgi:general stress protein 26